MNLRDKIIAWNLLGSIWVFASVGQFVESYYVAWFWLVLCCEWFVGASIFAIYDMIVFFREE